MRALLDTHAVLWWLADDHRLGPDAREVIADPANDVVVSAATAWEMSIKRALGKLDSPPDLPEQLRRQGFAPLSVDLEDGLAAGRLPRHHDDPFDRMLIAQARRRGLTLVSSDRRFTDYDVDIVW